MGQQGHLEGLSPLPGPLGGHSARPLAPWNQCFLFLSLAPDSGFPFPFFSYHTAAFSSLSQCPPSPQFLNPNESPVGAEM